MKNSVHYNPWQPLEAPKIKSIRALGMRYWVVQRFDWPGLPTGKAFICSPYRDKAQALEHADKLAEQEGKMLDTDHELAKLENLLLPSSDYMLFLNTFKESEKKWAKKTLDHYKDNIVRFVRSNTTLSLKELDINFKFVHGRLMALLISGNNSLEVFAYELIK